MLYILGLSSTVESRTYHEVRDGYQAAVYFMISPQWEKVGVIELLPASFSGVFSFTAREVVQKTACVMRLFSHMLDGVLSSTCHI